MDKHCVAYNKFRFCNQTAIVSTVQYDGVFETMVLYDDGLELETIRTRTLEDAKKTHAETYARWKAHAYDGSIQKLLDTDWTVDTIREMR